MAYKHLLETKGENEASKFSDLYLKQNKSNIEIEETKAILLNDEVNSKAQNVLTSFYNHTIEEFMMLFEERDRLNGSQDCFIDLINYVINRHK